MWLNNNIIERELSTNISVEELNELPLPYSERRGIKMLSGRDTSSKIDRRINQQYHRAMKRHSSHTCDLARHMYTTDAPLLQFRKSYLIGVGAAFNQFESEDIFIVSHFAPRNLKEGVMMLKEVASSKIRIIFAVTNYLANMLEKLGFDFIGTVPQMFNGEIVEKEVFSLNISEEEIEEFLQEQEIVA